MPVESLWSRQSVNFDIHKQLPAKISGIGFTIYLHCMSSRVR